MSSPKYKEIDSSDIEYLLNEKLILLVTATDLETNFTHKKIKPINGFEEILQVFDGNYTYYIGIFGNYLVAHVQCSMGSISRSSSIMTVNAALSKLKSKVVIMVGIAFGVNDEKQKIGDVLVSETIIPYNIKRVGAGDTVHRGQEGLASQLLLNRLRNIKTWEHQLDDSKIANLIFTRLLSGEELIDNLEHRNSLIKEFPDSLGGEMEGAGVCSACGDKIDWILIKGICDFADGEKGKNKKKRQEQAIESALSLCMELFNSKTVFKDLNILPFDSIEAESSYDNNTNINNVLFDLYDMDKENYYLIRGCDSDFIQKLKQYAIWIYGPSGCGKSNLILRNLLQNSFEVITINLASCIGQDVESLFKEILYELETKVGNIDDRTNPINFNTCVKAILNILQKSYKDKEVIIFIEEIPVDSSTSHSEFAEKLFSLIISKNFLNGLNSIKFVLSSLENPAIKITSTQNKIHQHMSFIPLEYWDVENILDLISIIEKEINWCLKPQIKSLLIEKANGSPRFIKKVFRSIYTLEKTDDSTIIRIITDTERELNSI